MSDTADTDTAPDTELDTHGAQVPVDELPAEAEAIALARELLAEDAEGDDAPPPDVDDKPKAAAKSEGAKPAAKAKADAEADGDDPLAALEKVARGRRARLAAGPRARRGKS